MLTGIRCLAIALIPFILNNSSVLCSSASNDQTDRLSNPSVVRPNCFYKLSGNSTSRFTMILGLPLPERMCNDMFSNEIQEYLSLNYPRPKRYAVVMPPVVDGRGCVFEIYSEDIDVAMTRLSCFFDFLRPGFDMPECVRIIQYTPGAPTEVDQKQRRTERVSLPKSKGRSEKRPKAGSQQSSESDH